VINLKFGQNLKTLFFKLTKSKSDENLEAKKKKKVSYE